MQDMKQGGFQRILYNFIIDMMQVGEVRLHHASTDEQIVDICTKPRSRTRLAGMKMFPWGSIDDFNIISIFQY
jgi:hypothetical protein